MPLDARRFGWSPDFPLWVRITGAMALLPSLYLESQTVVVNAYLSAEVKLQKDRGHTVVTTGVYRFVRHPKYVGDFLMLIGAPLLMGSLYGLLLAGLGLPLLIFRIMGEENMLLEELDGYAEYSTRVKYRLFPMVWQSDVPSYSP